VERRVVISALIFLIAASKKGVEATTKKLKQNHHQLNAAKAIGLSVQLMGRLAGNRKLSTTFSVFMLDNKGH
jgi:hypothetical protein